MLRDESKHPANQNKDEIIGSLAGQMVGSSCSNCGHLFDDGEHIRRYATFSAPSIYHRWSGRAVFCEDCRVYDVDDLPENTPGANAANAVIVGGVFYDNGRKQKFCPMYLKDRRVNEDATYQIPNDNDRYYHNRFRKYNAAVDGKTVNVPVRILKAVLTDEPTGRDDVPGLTQSDEMHLAYILLSNGINLDAVGLADAADSTA